MPHTKTAYGLSIRFKHTVCAYGLRIRRAHTNAAYKCRIRRAHTSSAYVERIRFTHTPSAYKCRIRRAHTPSAYAKRIRVTHTPSAYKRLGSEWMGELLRCCSRGQPLPNERASGELGGAVQKWRAATPPRGPRAAAPNGGRGSRGQCSPVCGLLGDREQQLIERRLLLSGSRTPGSRLA